MPLKRGGCQIGPWYVVWLFRDCVYRNAIGHIFQPQLLQTRFVVGMPVVVVIALIFMSKILPLIVHATISV